MIWSVAPVSAPLKAWNGEPGSRLIATGAPVIAACFAGSVYIAKRLSAGAGRTIDWEMMLRMVRTFGLCNIIDFDPLDRAARLDRRQGDPDHLLDIVGSSWAIFYHLANSAVPRRTAALRCLLKNPSELPKIKL